MKNLTRTFSLIAVVAIFLNSCKKEDSASCSDGIMNGTETGIDCGGSCPDACATCSDGIQNGDETDVDCGGSCPTCATCTDGIQNGDETGIDCGGSDCAACPTCTDGIQNGDETGVDCGGSCTECFTCGTSTVSDIDGNTYATVQIGNQCWTKQNLRTTTYNDGASIPYIPDGNDWFDEGLAYNAGYCYYDNLTANQSTYGNLYNWWAVNTGKLCPTGWHVPTDAEWQELIDSLGGTQYAGGPMKSTAGEWNSPNTGATNLSGFTSIPGGRRDGSGGFNYLGAEAHHWSSTDYGSNNSAYSLRNTYNFEGAYLDGAFNSKSTGYSCRCVKD